MKDDESESLCFDQKEKSVLPIDELYMNIYV